MMFELECLLAVGVLLSISVALMVAVRPKEPTLRIRRIPITE